MVARGFREAWRTSSAIVKLGVIVLGLVLIAALIIGGNSWWQNRAYEKREAEAIKERDALKVEREQLQLEKAQLKGQLAEQEAVNETLKTVAATKRTDVAAAVKEIDEIEKQHEARKQEIETTGGTLDDDALRREICERLRKRGYKLTCSN